MCTSYTTYPLSHVYFPSTTDIDSYNYIIISSLANFASLAALRRRTRYSNHQTNELIEGDEFVRVVWFRPLGVEYGERCVEELHSKAMQGGGVGIHDGGRILFEGQA